MSPAENIEKFLSGEIDILPVECFPTLLSQIHAMVAAKKKMMRETPVAGFPMKRLALLSLEAERLIQEDKYTQASIRMREVYRMLDF